MNEDADSENPVDSVASHAAIREDAGNTQISAEELAQLEQAKEEALRMAKLQMEQAKAERESAGLQKFKPVWPKRKPPALKRKKKLAKPGQGWMSWPQLLAEAENSYAQLASASAENSQMQKAQMAAAIEAAQLEANELKQRQEELEPKEAAGVGRAGTNRSRVTGRDRKVQENRELGLQLPGPARAFQAGRPYLHQGKDEGQSQPMTGIARDAGSPVNLAELKSHVRTIPDWPKEGVRFRDVTPLFQSPECFRFIVDSFARRYEQFDVDVIAGIEARGLVFGGAVANQLGLPFILVRKKGKLPFHTVEESYSLEYGRATIEIHVDSARPGDRIAILDDLIATGGTLLAASNLFKRIGAEVVEISAIIDLPELNGSSLLRAKGLKVHRLIQFSESE